jgi:hypothetical protein
MLLAMRPHGYKEAVELTASVRGSQPVVSAALQVGLQSKIINHSHNSHKTHTLLVENPSAISDIVGGFDKS